MEAAEQWEPDDTRVSRPVLRERGGEIPPRHSPLSENRRPNGLPLASRRRRRRSPRCVGPVQAKQARCAEADAQALEEVCLCSRAVGHRRLRSCSAAARDLGIERRHERGRWKNNRAENSHQPTRRQERKMQRFKSPGSAQNSCQRMPPSTTSSTSNVISPQPKRTAHFAPWRWTHGGPPSQQPENS